MVLPKALRGKLCAASGRRSGICPASLLGYGALSGAGLGLASHCLLPGLSPSRWLICGQTSSHRPLQTTVRRATMGFTCSPGQCIPGPLSRASTTNLLALSTAPLPMGYPLAWNSAYLIRSLRFSGYSRLPLTTFDYL